MNDGSLRSVSSFRPVGMVENVAFVDEFSSTASGGGLTNDCSVGALPGPDRSNNPELNCVLQLDNEINIAGLEGFEGLKSSTSSLGRSLRLPVGHGSQNDVHLRLKEFDEKVAKFHFVPLRAELTIGGFLKISSRVELESGTTPEEPFDEGSARILSEGHPA